ncbi:hypothetical protein CC85DRAFT_325040 [Cutaneotrichosporon oleaginosum]|uniref:Septin-type G domain-containing protein n=1 Tax=Cutaneotrichosporon oleaginosum TaxID=879819 RepID=A0A0J0XYW1_9TREE|nr:uncharacterized protein CC85DRAFT_325040 [Cutaneotrichosporon oleaginosum]KLT46250.1 hypothetical protein CC85DRAFT_325040 [Cutaneotrichosporon oleaginosum]TXT10256.1 hypothetical protein COLE_04190 [Cutaneotrichosporon oleaginosum]
MPISLLRKQPPRRKPDEPVPTLAALSFPEAKPLIDAEWASHARDAPAPAHAPTAYRHSYVPQYNNLAPRAIPIPGATSDSGHGPGHGHAGSAPGRSRAASQIRDATGASPDFHRPFSPHHIVPVQPISRPGTMRRARQRRAAPLTVIVAGPSGSGKTCLIDALTHVLDPQAPRLAVRVGPTTSVVRHDINVADERRGAVLLDTPGLPLPDELRKTRARALRALITMVEDRLSRVLAEESKVVRRKSDGGELVHLIIYVMDARTILCPASPVEIDWDTVMEPPANKGPTRPESELEPEAPGVAAKLSADDIEAMRQFSVRANVLPLLTHADALTTTELTAVRAAVRRDLAAVFGRDPLGPFGVLSAGQYEDDSGDDARDSEPDTDFPYVVFAPEPGPGFTRAFRWGRADAADPAHSDLPAVRNAIVDATDWLRQTTREVVYERFRTERLLNARGLRTKI